jgi:hypothetical protein
MTAFRLRDLANEIRGFLFYTNPVESADAAAWRAEDLARMQNVPGLNPAAVGRLLGAGLQHRIYEYQDGAEPLVLKVVVPHGWLRFPTADEAREDVRFVSQFLRPYALEPTEVVVLNDGSYAVKQRRLARFRGITRGDLSDEDTRRQFLDIVRRNQEMMQAGRSLDFLGREGQRTSRAALLGLGQTPTISNIVVASQPDGSQTLQVLDTDLENLRPGARSLRDRLSALAARVAVATNRLLIRRFFGIDIRKP